MEKKDLYTKNMVEKIYYGTENNGEEKIREQIGAFCDELYERRRDDSIEDGLQASVIIMPNAFAAKVNENDGIDPHKITEINLLRFLKNKNKYYKGEAAGNFMLIYDEAKEIMRKCVEIRIIDGKNYFMAAIVSNREIKSEYQIKVLKTVIDYLRCLQQSRKYTHVHVGFHTPLTTVEFEDIKENMYNRLITALEREKEYWKNNDQEIDF